MAEITKQDIVKKRRELGKKECLNWVLGMGPEGINERSAERSIDAVVKEFQSINKSQKAPNYIQKLEKFNTEIFKYPNSIPYKAKRNKSEIELETLKDMEDAKNVIHGLAKDWNSVSKENVSLQLENDDMKSKVQTRLATKTRLTKQIEIKKMFKRKVKHLYIVIRKKTRQLKQLRSANSYLLRKQAKLILNQDEIDSLKSEITTMKTTVQCLNKKNSELLAENEYLESLINENQEEVVLFDKDSNSYTSKTQECVYELLKHNVTTSHVSPVIESVLKVVEKKANRLPCTSTVNNMNIQRLVLAQNQIGEILTNEKNMCLLSDETSKFGKKVEGFHISIEKGNTYVLGTRQIVTKSGADTLSELQNILRDIDFVQQCSNSEITKHILSNIVSTMSDRAATQHKFNALLEDYRKDILQSELGDKWHALSESEKLAVSSLNNFFCSLHALVHIAEAACVSLKKVEDGLFENGCPILEYSFKSAGESGANRLIRTASKAFSCGGDEKSGAYGHFYLFVKDFLKEKKITSVPIKRFHGNRFNIVFDNAAQVFFMHDKITEFLKYEANNRLLKSIKHDIETTEILAGVKALGLLSCLVTTPLWCFIENKEVHILDSCTFYANLLSYTSECANSTIDFCEGKLFLNSEVEGILQKDNVFAKLTEPWIGDSTVVTILSTVIPAVHATMKKLFGEFIEGGKWVQADLSIRERTKSVPKHNKFSETIFGHLDRLLREKPNISTIAEEAYVMFVHNNTAEWLQNMDENKKETILRKARKNVRHTRITFQERRKHIEEERKRLLAKKWEEQELKEKRKLQQLEKETSQIIEWGLWQTEEQVDFQLSSYKTNQEKVAALKAQLNFRKNVLKHTPRSDAFKDVYRLTKMVGRRRVPLTVEELANNVKQLVKHALSVPVEDEDDEVQLVQRDISMRFETDAGLKWFPGRVISKVPGYPKWFNVKFEKDAAIYTYELLKDYQNGDIKIVVSMKDSEVASSDSTK